MFEEPITPDPEVLLAKRRRLLKLLAALVVMVLVALAIYFALKKSPDDYLQAGKRLQQQGDLAGAVIELKNVLRTQPGSTEARQLLGQVYLASGALQNAQKEFSRARELGVKDSALDIALAKTLLALNQPKDVLVDIQVPGSPPVEAQAAILALHGRAYLMLGDLAAAEEALHTADASSPNHPETLALRALLAFQKGQLPEAESWVEKALSSSPQRPDFLIMKADLLRQSKQNQQALQFYGKALSLEPGNIPARLAVTQIHLDAGALDKAEAELQRLQQYAPQNLMARFVSAQLDLRQSRYEAAERKIQDVLLAAPDLIPAHLVAGVCNMALGKREQAQNHLNRVLKAEPQHPLANRLMASTLVDMGQVEKAKELIATIRDAAADPGLLALRGEIALQQGNFTQARTDLETLVSQGSGTAQIFTQLAASRIGGGDTAGAIAALGKASDLDTRTSHPDALLVTLHLKQKNYAAAFQVVDKLERKLLARPDHKPDPIPDNLRGLVHAAKQDQMQARQYFGKALKIDPGYFPAVSNLARLDLQNKDFKAARSRFEALIKLRPNEVRAHLALAEIAFAQNIESDYLKFLEQAKRVDPKNVQARQQLVRYWLAQKQSGKALNEARDALNVTTLPQFYEWIGMALVQQGNQVEALAAFTNWAKANPQEAMAHFRVAQVQIAAKNDMAAMSALDRSLALRKDFEGALIGKALLLARMGRSEEAFTFARNLQKQPGQAGAGFLAEAEIHAINKHFSDAASLFVKAAEASGQSRLMLRAYQSFVAAGATEAGERELLRWLQTRPDDYSVRLQLAQAQTELKRYKESAASYRLLLKSNPHDPTVNNNLAWLLWEMHDPEALTFAERAYQQNKTNPGIQDTLGWILVNSGQSVRGVELIRQAARQLPDSPEVRWHYAFGLFKLGDKKNALLELDRLFAMRKPFPQESSARVLFDQLKNK